ncbi:MarR family winged helix-turn-helix transcriptional regulator [Chungangia koreensis]|uniref:MarR family winged helix-turn-helix transcriptional regulator n=1 Tax=Chungangia koreensis TaxID=752657 RepID=A0ABV8X5B9_9LACT
MTMEKMINEYWTDIYYHLHYEHDEKITHQAVRILQHIEKSSSVGIREISDFLHVSQNTASEHVKRLIDKKFLEKKRDLTDERKVILNLTDRGREVLFRNTALDEDKLSVILRSLSDEEKSMIMKAFRLISEGAKSCM